VGFEQVPFAGSQTPGCQPSDDAQATASPAWKVPATQLSAWVQALPSLQEVPSSTTGFEQRPVEGAQVPAAWHWSEAVQVTGFAPVQAPAWQLSVWVQASPSVQEVPSATGGFEQSPVEGAQVPAAWHWSEAVQVTGF